MSPIEKMRGQQLPFLNHPMEPSGTVITTANPKTERLPVPVLILNGWINSLEKMFSLFSKTAKKECGLALTKVCTGWKTERLRSYLPFTKMCTGWFDI